MDDAKSQDHRCLPENILQPLFTASNSSNLDKALENLIEIAKSDSGRTDLASKNILIDVLQLCNSLPYPSGRDSILLYLKLLRNLCAGEITNQNLFIKQNGVGIVAAILSSSRVDLGSGLDNEAIRMGLQVLGNVSLAGEEHQRAVWGRFFPLEFAGIAGIKCRGTCDPLCMIIYTCCDGCNGLIAELSADQGLPILVEIVRTAAAVGFGEDWFKLLLSRVCLEESLFSPLFTKLCSVGVSDNNGDIISRGDRFVPDQAFFLGILSEILNEQIGDISVLDHFALNVFQIFRSAAEVVDSVSKKSSALPTGCTVIDVLGYSLTILRDICACDCVENKEEGSSNVVDLLVSSGLLELLLCLLRDLEPPAIIKKGMKHDENQERSTGYSPKPCPYKGFRRDIVSVIGNCAYGRKHIQDDIRQKNGVLLLLQQCVTDEDNPYLREWGIWSVRNLLEGNAENQRLVAELELQGSVEVPELAGMGLRVEVDQKTRRAKLVNT